MNAQEATALARYARAARPQQKWDEYTPDVWADVLDDIDFSEARIAVRNLAKNAAFVDVDSIRAQVRRVRDERLAAHVKDIPPYPDPDDVAAAKAHEVSWRRRIADGEVPPPPAAVPGRELPPLGNLLASPPAVAAAARARRGARTVACPWCKAIAGEPCTRDGRPVSWTHSARQEAAQ